MAIPVELPVSDTMDRMVVEARCRRCWIVLREEARLAFAREVLRELESMSRGSESTSKVLEAKLAVTVAECEVGIVRTDECDCRENC